LFIFSSTALDLKSFLTSESYSDNSLLSLPNSLSAVSKSAAILLKSLLNSEGIPLEPL